MFFMGISIKQRVNGVRYPKGSYILEAALNTSLLPLSHIQLDSTLHGGVIPPLPKMAHSLNQTSHD
ncbi:hypothetical protein T4A_4160 [Trichinella pseudospiralis]|uniref:Uncharacterized protein n=1 Tax=Trichinella pseudospiralis TaxID=6337 RepID=A0A0V1EVN3_TRIPS|nr:hypothetical protein T4A_4160 [Trichinella pseudospiralis]